MKAHRFVYVSSLGSKLAQSVDLNPPKEHLDCVINLNIGQTDMDEVCGAAKAEEITMSAMARYLVRLGLAAYKSDPEEEETEPTEFERILKERA